MVVDGDKLYARVSGGVARTVGRWRDLGKPVDRVSGVRLAALPSSDAAWTAAYLIDKYTPTVPYEEVYPASRLTEAGAAKYARKRMLDYMKEPNQRALGDALYHLAMVAELERTNPSQ